MRYSSGSAPALALQRGERMNPTMKIWSVNSTSETPFPGRIECARHNDFRYPGSTPGPLGGSDGSVSGQARRLMEPAAPAGAVPPAGTESDRGHRDRGRRDHRTHG